MSPLPRAVLVVFRAQGPWPVLGSPPAAAERDFERLLLATPDSASLRAMSRDLTRLPHMAGTPAQAVTRDYVVEKLRSWGLESWTKEYTVYLPQPEIVAAWLIARPGAAAVPLALREPPVPGNPATQGPQVPPFNGYTGDGDVTGDVVYVNYGLIEDDPPPDPPALRGPRNIAPPPPRRRS